MTVEHGATSILKDAGAKGRGLLPRKIREKGKVDILLWWGECTPRAVIEIKNKIFYKEQYQKDIERIIGFLDRNSQESSLQFGIFAFYLSETNDEKKTATEKIEERIKKIYQNSKAIIGENFNITKKTSDNVVDDSAWAATCLIIKHRNYML